MKNRIFFVAIVLAAFLYSGCDKLDVDFKADYSTNLNVVIPPSGVKAFTGYPFSVSSTIDPMSDSDFAKYANKIKDVNVKEVIAEITSINKEVVLLNCTLAATSPNYSSAEWYFENENLTVGKKFTLANESGKWDNIQKILTDKKILTVSANGSTDQNDVQFTIKVTIKTVITAGAL